MLRGTQKERGMIISEKEEIDYINSRAKARKKRWIGCLLIVRNSSHKE